MGFAECVIVAQALLLAACGLRWLAGRREVKVVREGDYRDGRPRSFLPLEVGTSGTAEGTHLVDARTGRPVVFSGVTASQVHVRFRAAGRRAGVMVLLEGVPLRREVTDEGEGVRRGAG